jgi:broad specificity phosphatase PhoE
MRLRVREIFPLLCLLFFCDHCHIALAQSTIFVTRHADRYGTEPDPALTPKGEEQARSLARLLSKANVKHIFTTELIRTQETAAPLAHQINVAPVVVPQDNFEELIKKIRGSLRTNESILVVGHRETVPRIVHVLTGKDIPPLGSGEYGRLIAITVMPNGSTSVVTLRYTSPLD